MKNALLILGAALCCAATCQAAEKWLPGKISYYSWDTNGWAFNSDETFTYNESGQPATKCYDGYKTVYEYDANGQCISEIGYELQGRDYVNNSKDLYTYDEVVTNFVINEESYHWYNGKWVLDNSQGYKITRNADGNVTKVESTGNDSGEEYYTISYGQDGKASEINVSEDGGAVSYTISDIIWERTDGQILEFDIESKSFYRGANRIKSATVTNYKQYRTTPLFITAEYPAEDFDPGSFKYTFTSNSEVQKEYEFKALDQYESYEKTDSGIDYEYDEETGTYVRGAKYIDYDLRRCDEYGLSTEYIHRSHENGVLVYESKETGTVTYDTANGYPLEYVTKYMSDGVETNSTKEVYSDYVKVNGIYDIATAADDCVEEYYNLQGVRVAKQDLTPGIYIRRQGRSISKMLVK